LKTLEINKNALDGVVCRTFLSASHFHRSAIVKCYVEDFGRGRRCGALPHFSIYPPPKSAVFGHEAGLCTGWGRLSNISVCFAVFTVRGFRCVYRDLILEALCLSRWY
jgi:hypothetical protein